MLGPDTIMLMVISGLAGLTTGIAWRIYDKVDKMERILAAVVQKIGGVEL